MFIKAKKIIVFYINNYEVLLTPYEHDQSTFSTNSDGILGVISVTDDSFGTTQF